MSLDGLLNSLFDEIYQNPPLQDTQSKCHYSTSLSAKGRSYFLMHLACLGHLGWSVQRQPEGNEGQNVCRAEDVNPCRDFPAFYDWCRTAHREISNMSATRCQMRKYPARPVSERFYVQVGVFLLHSPTFLCRALPKLSLISFASQLTQIGLLHVCFRFKQCVSREGVEWEDEDEQLEVLCGTANNGRWLKPP